MSEGAARTGTETPAPLLSVRGLRKYFSVKSERILGAHLKVQAVDGVDLDVQEGETLGIVGESGCGKSTTARLLMRLIAPDAGDVIFAGKRLGGPSGMSLRELRRRMQMVFQDSYASLNPRLSVQDSIAFGPRAHGMARLERPAGLAGGRDLTEDVARWAIARIRVERQRTFRGLCRPAVCPRARAADFDRGRDRTGLVGEWPRGLLPRRRADDGGVD